MTVHPQWVAEFQQIINDLSQNYMLMGNTNNKTFEKRVILLFFILS